MTTTLHNGPTRPIDDNTPGTVRHPLRWMVRREYRAPSRFGEPMTDGISWAVTPYIGRTSDGRLFGGFTPTYFSTRSAALAFAHRQQRMTYGTRR